MQLILSNSDYTFDASAKEITLLLPFDTLDEERILRITNIETNAVIYDSERRTHPIAVAAGVITHTYDLTGMADADILQIIVDDGTSVGAEIDAFSDTLLFDDFDDESLSTTLWGTPVLVVSTVVTESSSAPNTLRIYNPGTGTLGAGYVPSIDTFGRNVSVRSKIDLHSSVNCFARIELYKDADDYVYFGARKDGTADSRAYLWYNIAGAGAATVDINTTDTDNIAREYRIDVSEENLMFYVDDILVYTLKDASLDNYYIRPYAASFANGDVLDIRFDYVKVLRLSEDRRLLLKKLLQIQGGDSSIGSITNALDSSMDMGSSRASTVMTGAEQILYEESSDTPFTFNGGYIDFTGCTHSGGEDTTVKCYIKIKSGGTYRLIYTETYLAAALPSPICVPVPRLATDVTPGKLCGMYGVKVTATQAAIGASWNSIDNEFFDEMA